MSKTTRQQYGERLVRSGGVSSLAKTEASVEGNAWTTYSIKGTGQIVCRTINHMDFYLGA